MPPNSIQGREFEAIELNYILDWSDKNRRSWTTMQLTSRLTASPRLGCVFLAVGITAAAAAAMPCPVSLSPRLWECRRRAILHQGRSGKVGLFGPGLGGRSISWARPVVDTRTGLHVGLGQYMSGLNKSPCVPSEPQPSPTLPISVGQIITPQSA